MSTVESIRQAIQMLSVEERAEITAELCGWTDDDWDRQMKADGAAGKFAPLNREADTSHVIAPCAPGQVECGMSRSSPALNLSQQIRRPHKRQI